MKHVWSVPARLARRCWLVVFVAIVTFPTAFPGLVGAQEKPLKKVRIVAATGILDVTYSMLTLPVALGYWREEGYDVDVQPAGGSLQVIQQVVGGNADFGAASGNAMIQANAKNDLPVRVVMNYATSDWALVVDANGPIKDVKDLKGKTVGVYNLASGGIPFLNGLLRANGMDPKDVELVATAMGATPVQAMRAGRAQGLVYWGSAIASFENAGLTLRKMMGADWDSYPEYSLGTMAATAEKDPDMVVGIARGSVKAMVFLATNPECTVKVQWSHFPSTKPTGADDATLMEHELHSLKTQGIAFAHAHKIFGKDKEWGRFDADGWNRLSHFMVEAKQIDKPFPAETLELKIPNLYQKINDFDVEAIQESARACKF
jgi:NitT/TauT family transport system substrate-binding protein